MCVIFCSTWIFEQLCTFHRDNEKIKIIQLNAGVFYFVLIFILIGFLSDGVMSGWLYFQLGIVRLPIFPLLLA